MLETMTGKELMAYSKAGRLWKVTEKRKGVEETTLVIAEDSPRAAIAYNMNTERPGLLRGFHFEVLPGSPSDLFDSDDPGDWTVPVRVLVDENPEKLTA